MGAWYCLALLSIKITFGLLFLRIFRVTRAFRWAVYLILALCTLFHLAFFALAISQASLCSYIGRPPQDESPLCLNYMSPIVISATFGLFSDLYLFLLPIAPIVKLQVSMRQRVGLLAIFGAGLA